VACLLQNSLDAVTDGESIDVEVSNYLDGEGQLARLRITDRGHGLTLLDCEHLFDPFYSGRQAGRGLGFGLSKCWRIATMHGGTIEVESQPDTGTTFVVLLPSASGP
jgi:signal transduction histidine kinase